MNPANLTGIDYHNAPPRRTGELPLIDSHVHLRGSMEAIALFFRAADLYGISKVLTMSHLEFVEPIRQAYGQRVEFIAIPDFRQFQRSAHFQQRWCNDIARFVELGARLCKFWAAPRARAEHGLTLSDPWLRPVIDRAAEFGLGMMVHVGDPDLWYATRYADRALYGTKREALDQFEWFLAYVSPTPVIGAHFAGHPEHLDTLDRLLSQYRNLYIDTSATKWVAREMGQHPPDRLREFFARHRERILFGSDLVVDGDYDFDHYASRYWVQQTLWESGFDGPSPIFDPDAPSGIRLRGLSLDRDILQDVRRNNSHRLLNSLTGRTPPR